MAQFVASAAKPFSEDIAELRSIYSNLNARIMEIAHLEKLLERYAKSAGLTV